MLGVGRPQLSPDRKSPSKYNGIKEGADPLNSEIITKIGQTGQIPDLFRVIGLDLGPFSSDHQFIGAFLGGASLPTGRAPMYSKSLLSIGATNH